MSGAAYFNAAAAYRTGAGLVEIYTSGANRIVLQSLLPEAIVTTYDSYEEEKLRELLDKADAVCIGSVSYTHLDVSKRQQLQLLKQDMQM